MRPSLFAVSAACLLLASTARAQSDSAPKERVVKLAAPGFTAVNVDEKVANFFSDHFAQRLSLEGLQVISASEIQTLIGFERSKALMGCNENSASCMAELGDALGVDGIITGSIGKFGGTYQANIKVLAAGNARPLSIISRRAGSDEELLTVLNEVAEVATDDVLKNLNVKLPDGARVRRGNGARRAREQGGTSAPAAAPVPQKPQNVVSLVAMGQWFPEGAGGGGVGLEYERLLSPMFTFFVRPDFTVAGGELVGFAAFEAAVGARWYLGGSAPHGLWLAPEVNLGIYGVANAQYPDGIGEVGIGPAASVGYSVPVGSVLLSASVGTGAFFVSDVTLFQLHARAAVGYNF